MKRTTILLLAGLALAGAGCHWMGVRGNGHVTTDQRPVSEFAEIQADGMFDIVWSSGPAALTITTDDNLLSYVESTVHDGRLRLHVRQRILPTHGLKVAISSQTRTGSRLTGASDLTAHALAFSAGTFLCIALSDLLPELQFHTHDRIKLSVALLAGFVLMGSTAAWEDTSHAHGGDSSGKSNQ